MFGRLSTIPQFVDDKANAIFTNITGCSFDDDYTFLATLRSLLFNRLEENKEFTFDVSRHNTDSGILSATSKDDMNTWFYLDSNHDSINIKLISTNTDEEFITFCDKLKNKKTGICAKNKSYEELSDLCKYFKQKYDIDIGIFINRENNCALVIANSAHFGIQISHIVASFIPRLLPSMFKENKLTDEERKVLEALTQRNANNFLERISILANNPILRRLFVQSMLDGFEKRSRENMLTAARNQYESLLLTMSELMERYDESCRKMDEINIRIEGIKALIDKGDKSSEITDYFAINDSLDLLEVEDRKIKFIVRTHLDNYDANVYQRFAEDGDIYNNYAGSIDVFNNKENRKLLLDNLFSEEPTLRIRMCAYFCIDLNGTVSSKAGYAYDNKYINYIPNPHLQIHNCLNTNRTLIQDQLKKGCLVGAVQCCMSSASSVNLLETTQTFRPMVRDIFRSDNKIIETNNGDLLTPKEAVAWLKERNEKKEEEE